MRLRIALACSLLTCVAACGASPDQLTHTPATLQQTSATPRNDATQKATGKQEFNACELISPSEVKAIIGGEVKETKTSNRVSGAFNVSQCFYVADPYVKSVSLEVTRDKANAGGENGLRNFWKTHFVEAKQTKKSEKPEAVSGVGEGAFWVGSSKVGALYVIKESTLLRVSIGGAEGQPEKMDKSKKLARQALRRL